MSLFRSFNKKTASFALLSLLMLGNWASLELVQARNNLQIPVDHPDPNVNRGSQYLNGRLNAPISNDLNNQNANTALSLTSTRDAQLIGDQLRGRGVPSADVTRALETGGYEGVRQLAIRNGYNADQLKNDGRLLDSQNRNTTTPLGSNQRGNQVSGSSSSSGGGSSSNSNNTNLTGSSSSSGNTNNQTLSSSSSSGGNQNSQTGSSSSSSSSSGGESSVDVNIGQGQCGSSIYGGYLANCRPTQIGGSLGIGNLIGGGYTGSVIGGAVAGLAFGGGGLNIKNLAIGAGTLYGAAAATDALKDLGLGNVASSAIGTFGANVLGNTIAGEGPRLGTSAVAGSAAGVVSAVTGGKTSIAATPGFTGLVSRFDGLSEQDAIDSAFDCARLGSCSTV